MFFRPEASVESDYIVVIKKKNHPTFGAIFFPNKTVVFI